MKHLLVLLFVLFSHIIVCSQTILQPDTCIDMKYYKSYCTKTPLQVSYCTYILYKPKSNVSRYGCNFHGSCKHFDYNKSGYDKGHLVPAEDMEYDKESMNNSFVWWNCVPQTPKLNRGNWRVEEEKWHDYANQDSLFIIVGACNFTNGIPKYCYKIVKSLSKKKVISITIYNQQGNKIPIPKNFLKQFNIHI